MCFKDLYLSLLPLMYLAPISSLMFLTTTVNLLILLQPYGPHCYSSSPPNFHPGCLLSQECSENHLVNFVTSFNLFSNGTFSKRGYLLKVLLKFQPASICVLIPGTLDALTPINFLYCLVL